MLKGPGDNLVPANQPGAALVALEGGALDSVVCVLEQELEQASGPRAYAPLTEAYRQQGKLEDALRVARSGALAFPGHVGIRVVLGRALADAGLTDEARVAYEEVLRLDPENREAQAVLGLLSRRAPAAAKVQEPAPQRGGGPERPASLSEELAHLSDLFCARPDAACPASEREFSGIATLTLAEIYARQGLTERAVEVCETILERRPDDSTAKTRLEQYRRSLASLR